MKVLIPYDINTTGQRNPYLFLLLRALETDNTTSRVQHGFGWLYEPGEWDIIHLHWPEVLIDSILPGPFSESTIETGHIRKLVRTLAGWKERGTRIVVTVHNETPHRDPSGQCDELYREIYTLADGFIHMGKSSGTLVRKRYPGQTRGKIHAIIPHGNYSYFPDTKDRIECRRELNIDDDQKLLLAFGAIRSREELELGIRAFKRAAVPGSVYLMAGKIPSPFKKQISHYRDRKLLYIRFFDRSIRTVEKIIPPEDVQIYLKAADLLLIPRFNTLNSGNVALGFTFGRVVAGPDYGVTGEMLKINGNPVFDPHKIESVSRAIKQGFERSESELGEKNRAYALTEMDWQQVSARTTKAYRAIVKAPEG